MRVRIKSVTLPDGTPRADDKYPVRAGSLFNVVLLESGSRMMLDYICDNEGNPKIGTLVTSPVTTINYLNGDIDAFQVITRNSVYLLERVMDDAAD